MMLFKVIAKGAFFIFPTLTQHLIRWGQISIQSLRARKKSVSLSQQSYANDQLRKKSISKRVLSSFLVAGTGSSTCTSRKHAIQNSLWIAGHLEEFWRAFSIHLHNLPKIPREERRDGPVKYDTRLLNDPQTFVPKRGDQEYSYETATRETLEPTIFSPQTVKSSGNQRGNQKKQIDISYDERIQIVNELIETKQESHYVGSLGMGPSIRGYTIEFANPESYLLDPPETLPKVGSFAFQTPKHEQKLLEFIRYVSCMVEPEQCELMRLIDDVLLNYRWTDFTTVSEESLHHHDHQSMEALRLSAYGYNLYQKVIDLPQPMQEVFQLRVREILLNCP